MASPEQTAPQNQLTTERMLFVGKGLEGVSRNVGRTALGMASGANVLLIATPAGNIDQAKYDKYVKDAGGSFVAAGARVNNLHEFNSQPTQTQIDHEIGTADIIYISGGSTQYAKKFFAETGIDKALHGVKKEKVLMGASAGVLLLAESGLSYVTNPNEDPYFTLESGLAVLKDWMINPHFDYKEPKVGQNANNELPRSHFLQDIMSNPELAFPQYKVGIDDDAAFAINAADRWLKVISQNSTSGVHMLDGSGAVTRSFEPSEAHIPISHIDVAA